MSDLRQAAQQALERLEACVCPPSVHHDIINPLRAALKQQQADPVACPIGLDKKGASQFCSAGYCDACKQQQAEPVFENLDYVAVVYSPSNAMLKNPLPIGTHLYKYPPLRKPLTDEQIDAGVKAWFENPIVAGRQPFAKRMRAAIEAAHGIQEPKQ